MQPLLSLYRSALTVFLRPASMAGVILLALSFSSSVIAEEKNSPKPGQKLAQKVAQKSKIIHVRLTSKPQTLDWNRATIGSEKAIIQNIMEGLFQFDERLEVVPDLAESFSWSPDGKSLDIRLRKKVRWLDEVELKPQHFVDSFERLLNPSFNSPNASLFFDIKNAREYFFGKVKKFSEVGVEVTGPQSLRITLNEPRANFLNTLTHWATFPVRKEKPLLTLGPYFLETTTPDALYLKLNPHYFGKKPTIPEVIFEVIPDGKTAIAGYRSKKLDYLLQVEDELLDEPEVKALKEMDYVNPIRVVALLHFNPGRTQTNTPEKRRRIMQAVAVRKMIAQSPNTRLFATSIIPPVQTPLSKVVTDTPPSPEKASLPDSPLLLGYPQDALSKSIAEQIQIYSLPLKIKLEPMASRDESLAKRYDLILTLFGLDYFDPDQLLNSFFSQGTHDFFNLSSAELLQLVEKARKEPKARERAAYYAEAASYLQNKIAAVMPLFYRRRAYLLSPAFHYRRGIAGSANISHLTPSKIK